jgi:DNA-binding IclR family transcriptional regulator
VATPAGFALVPRRAEVRVLLPPFDDAAAKLLALLAAGEAWSSSALALALGVSQRNVQRALLALEAAGKVQGLGRGRARRWLTPAITQFSTHLLLPTPSHEP